jgi:hypothetical protein
LSKFGQNRIELRFFAKSEEPPFCFFTSGQWEIKTHGKKGTKKFDSVCNKLHDFLHKK